MIFFEDTNMSDSNLKVVLFSGGRGTTSISKVLIEHPQIELTILVNAYDDGLSTGRLRKFIPGMLGPSDLRKNISTLMPIEERCFQALQGFLDYRFADGMLRKHALNNLLPLAAKQGIIQDDFLRLNYRKLSVEQAEEISQYCQAFIDYEKDELVKARHFDYGDCSIGNILFAGCYLICNQCINQTISKFAEFCECRGVVFNITDGQNFVLTAIKKDGEYLSDEVSIVSPQGKSPIIELFLLRNYLESDDMKRLNTLSTPEKINYLSSLHNTPKPNNNAINAIKDADLIIYGPGTQNSSLLPSYLTEEIAETIIANTRAEKIFIGNIVQDHDIQDHSAQNLLDAFLFNMSRKNSIPITLSQVVTSVFLHSGDDSQMNRKLGAYVPHDVVSEKDKIVKSTDWELSNGCHIGGHVVDEMLSIINKTAEIEITPSRHMVSIVIPVLNEERTIEKVLHDCEKLDVTKMGINKEIILVDGGSTDDTLKIANQHKQIRLFTHQGKKLGRGEAIRMGISKSRGNIIVVFPSDGEYEVQDIVTVLQPIVTNQFNVVFGSRMIRCLDLRKRIRNIYGKTNWVAYAASRYGGMAFSVLSLLLYNRFLSDPFSTLKAFDGIMLKSLNLTGTSVNLEAEIIAKISRNHQFILEVPVNFHPRTKAQGKKTTIIDGIKTLVTLIIWKFKKF